MNNTDEMTEFWESNFRDKQAMWGFEPADSAFTACELFKQHKLNKVLIPGIGYGRNAKVFTKNGFGVTGIEISATAIELAHKYYGNEVKIYHASVSDMPLDQALYGGIFCYALIHLLSPAARIKLIDDCYNQLLNNGLMVFIVVGKMDPRYGRGKEIAKDTFETYPGVSLYFYDAESIEVEFGKYGLIEVVAINEPLQNTGNMLSQRFWKIVCRK